MKTSARGALLYVLLPTWPSFATVDTIQRRLEERGVRLHRRSIQRDLSAMPADIVRRRGASPDGWGRAS